MPLRKASHLANNLEEVDHLPEQMELYKKYDEGHDIQTLSTYKLKEIYFLGENCNEWEELEKSLAEEFSYIELYTPGAVLDNTCTIGEPFEEPLEGIIEINNAPASMPELVSEASVSSFQQPSSSFVTLNASEEGNGLKNISKCLVQYTYVEKVLIRVWLQSNKKYISELLKTSVCMYRSTF